jgi:hypothetical protein
VALIATSCAGTCPASRDATGTGNAESTIRTMIVSHLCRNAPDHAATTYDDLERVGRGLYRLATHRTHAQ